MENAKRIEWIDFARGIGMLLVILGHCRIPNPYWKAIYMFHLPLFFMVSGCIYSPKKNSIPFIQFVKQNAKKYLLPYLVFSFTGITLTFLLFKIYGVGFSYTQVGVYSLGIFAARGEQVWTGQWGAIWYLFATFNLLLMVKVINKVKNPWGGVVKLLASVLGPVICYLANRYVFWAPGPGWLPWNFGAAFMAIPIFYVGYDYRNFIPIFKNFLENRLGKFSKYILFIFGIVLFLIGLFVGSKNQGLVAFSNNNYGNIPLMLVGAIFIPLGIFFIVDFVYSFALIRVKGVHWLFQTVEWVGKNSLLFLGIHGMTIPPVTIVLNKLLNNFSFYVRLRWLFVFIAVLAANVLIIILYKTLKEKLLKYIK